MTSALPESQTLRLRRMSTAGAQLLDIIQSQKLTTLFQPLVDTQARCIFGFEALTRGPSDSPLHSPQHLFDAARQCQRRLELELLCVELAARRFVQSGVAGRLFVNVSPDCIYDEPCFAELFLAILGRAALPAERCAIELTEDGILDDYAMLRQPLQQLRHAGCEFAIDDLGAGSSGLRIWSELRPDYVKIDRYFISGIDTDSTKLGFVRSIIDLGRAIGCRIIAEGVETPGECRELVGLGIDRLQGFMFGRPELVPDAQFTPLDALAVPGAAQVAMTAGQLVKQQQPVAPKLSVAQLADMFRGNELLSTIAVVEEERVLGVVRRHELFALLSRPFHREIYNRKPVTAVMTREVPTVDARLRLEQVSRLVTQMTDANWIDEFIITDEGRYLGLGRTLQLLRHITDQQIQIARHSNPLTLLPGNGPIKDCINSLLSSQTHFVICYVDVDYFKPYNDVYGYVQGDQIIMHVAELLKRAACSRLDFLGHLGGDDFVLVMRSPDWSERIQQMLADFGATIADYYRPEDVAAGSIEAPDRDGSVRRFPLLSVSVAALDSRSGGCSSAEAAAQQLVEVKTLAKRHAGNVLLLRNAEGITVPEYSGCATAAALAAG